MNDYKYGRQDDELMHFGVLGMKWGHRSGGKSQGSSKKLNTALENNNRSMSNVAQAKANVKKAKLQQKSVKKEFRNSSKELMKAYNDPSTRKKYKTDVRKASRLIGGKKVDPKVDGKAYADRVNDIGHQNKVNGTVAVAVGAAWVASAMLKQH